MDATPLRLDTPWGPFWVPREPDTDHLARCLREGKVYDEGVVGAAMEYARPGTTVIDLGACFGQFSVILADKVGPSGRVRAFECQPAVLGSLRRTLAEPGRENILLEERAAYDVTGLVLPFPEAAFDDRYVSWGCFHIDPRQSLAPKVTTVRVDDVIGPDEEVSFIKVDVNTCDLQAMRGALFTVLRCRCPVLYEYEPLSQELWGLGLSDYDDFVGGINYRLERLIGGAGHNFLIVPR